LVRLGAHDLSGIRAGPSRAQNMRVDSPPNEAHMDDDFDNDMGLPEDELAGGSGSDQGDLGLGGMDAEDEMDSEAPGRPSGGARARSASGSMRGRKRAAAAPAARKSASRVVKRMSGGRKKGAKKKGAKKSAGARKASRKTARKAAPKAARRGGRKRKAGRKR
jgi:hypothetical protein